MHRIELDRVRGLLILTLSGFWTADEARTFAREEEDAVARLGRSAGGHLILADITEFAVQSQEVSAILRELLLGAANSSRKIALLGKPGLAAVQSKRLTSEDEARFFEDKAAAIAWLTED